MIKIIFSITILIGFSVLFLLNPSKTSAYTECGSPTYIKRGMPFKVYVSKTTLPPGVSYDQMVETTRRSWQAWADLPDSNISFVFVDTESQASHIIKYYNMHGYNLAHTGCPFSPIPINTYIDNGGTRPFDPDSSDGVDADKWSLEVVLLHETGHFLGLDHSCVTVNAIMCVPLAKATSRVIDPDAQNAMRIFYSLTGSPTPSPTPGGGGITPSPSPTPLPTLTPTPTPSAKRVVACEKVATYDDGSKQSTSLPLSDCSVMGVSSNIFSVIISKLFGL